MTDGQTAMVDSKVPAAEPTPAPQTTQGEPAAVPETPRRSKRPGRRKAGFRMSTPPFPVRAIWELASPEERQKAHSLAAMLLEHWLGRCNRMQMSEKLGIPPLRVWQLSQQGLAGLTVALLRQPKRPPKGTPLPDDSVAQDSRELRKQLEEALRQKETLERLVEVLKALPSRGGSGPEAKSGQGRLAQEQSRVRRQHQDHGIQERPASKPERVPSPDPWLGPARSEDERGA